MDLATDSSAGRFEEKAIAAKGTLRDVISAAGARKIGFVSDTKSITVYISNNSLHADAAHHLMIHHLMNNDDIDLTEEEFDIAKTAVRLSLSNGLSSGEDHIARIKSILSVG